MYTHANLSFSEYKMKRHVKKHNTFKYNILNCYPSARKLEF